MTESEKRALALSIQANLQSSSRADALRSATSSATQSVIDHMVQVNNTFKAMGKGEYTVDDLIAAYNKGTSTVFDFSVFFFYSAYAIALKEAGRDVMEDLNSAPIPEGRHTFRLNNHDEMVRRGITKRDLQRAERLGESNTKKDFGFEELFRLLGTVEDEDMLNRIQEIMDEEIDAEGIMERCKQETGVDIKEIMG